MTPYTDPSDAPLQPQGPAPNRGCRCGWWPHPARSRPLLARSAWPGPAPKADLSNTS